VSDETNKVAEEASPVEAEGSASATVADAPVDASSVEGSTAPVEEAVDEALGAVEEAVDEAVEEEGGEEEAAEDEADAAEEEGEGDEEELAEEESAEEAVEEEPAEEDSDEIKMEWYILKVQSNREKSISAALKRKIAVEGLEDYFDDVIVPVEKVTEFKGGKKKVVNRKLYPGYIVVHMCINDDTWFAVRETSGIGDFTGSGGKPTPMLPHEVARIIQDEEEETEDTPKLNINFKVDDKVKVNDGNFESFEGDVSEIDEQSGRITVMINIFGRSTPVELEYWQVEQI